MKRLRYLGMVEVKPSVLGFTVPFIYPGEVREYDDEAAEVLLTHDHYVRTFAGTTHRDFEETEAQIGRDEDFEQSVLDAIEAEVTQRPQTGEPLNRAQRRARK